MDCKRLGLCQHHRVGHTHLLSQENDKLRTSYLSPLTPYLSSGFRLDVIGNRFRQFARRMAEREGFEPPDPCGSTVFKTAAIDHSATSPNVGTFDKTQMCTYYTKIFSLRVTANLAPLTAAAK